MLNQPTLEKLHAMRLAAMADAWQQQHKDPELAKLSFDERFGLLVDAEHLARDDRKLTRLLREAKLRWRDACIEDIDYPPRRALDRSVVRQLANCRWVDEHLNIIITGATGTGKSYLCCAFAQQACRRGYRALYRRVPRLLHELKLARADGTMPKLLGRFLRFDVLVLDDWGLAPLTDADRHDLLEILEDRDSTRASILTSQLPIAQWHDHIGDPTVADAILDRVIHGAYKIPLKGGSRRKDKATSKNS